MATLGWEEEVELVCSWQDMFTGFWSFHIFESNESLGENKPNFMTGALDWPTQPIEASWHHYVEEHLTCDEGEKMVTHPGNGSKPKQMLSTSSKGQAMLPTNCLTAHGDRSQFLNYQKQVLRAFVERMYSPCLHFIRRHFLTIIIDLVVKRTSGHVPWLEFITVNLISLIRWNICLSLQNQ